MRVEKTTYLDLPNCYRLSNETVEVIVSTDVGPRVLHYGFIGAENMLGAAADVIIKTELGDWQPRGGHRLWAAPEALPRSYAPDNDPLQFEIEGERAIRLRQPTEAVTGLQKEMDIVLDAGGTAVTIHHRLTNRNVWPIEAAPWALTIMRGGGLVILPQEPYRAWAECLQPARPLVLWHYTDLSDPRWSVGARSILLRVDANRETPQKLGIMNRQGWAAYHTGATLFVKSVAHEADATYPDYGCNTEVYTAGSFVEVETLGPLRRLEPGAAAVHVERWQLFRNVNLGPTEAAILDALKPFIAQFQAHI